MSVPRIDVVVPGAEGGWIARALREAGFDVREADDARGSEDADAIVLDRAVKGFDDALDELSTPLRVVVGWDPPDAQDLDEWKAHATFVRPVSIPKLLASLGTALGLPQPPQSPVQSPILRATMPAPATGDVKVEILGREPTMNLEPVAVERTFTLEDVPTLDEVSTDEPESSNSALDSGVAELSSTGVTAEFSPYLAGMMRDADRRIFPNDPPLDLRFPGGDEPAELLVPDELLAEVAMPIDLPDADPLEAFTFVGTPDLSSSGLRDPARSQVGSSASDDHTPHTVRERAGGASSDSVASSTSVRSDIAREGMLPAAGAIRVIWQAHDDPRAVETRFDVAGGPSLTLGTFGGELISFEGPAHLQVVADLRSEGQLRAAPDDEDTARVLLQDEVRFGRMAPFELARRLRESRESLIHALVVAPEARFSMRSRSGAPAPKSLVHGPLVAVACEGARRRVGCDEALQWLGFAPHAKLTLTSSFAERAVAARLEPELIEAFEAAAEGAVAELLGGPRALVGVAGALLTLASGDAVRVDGEADAYEIQAAAARERVLAAHARAAIGSYFAVLGVPPNASSRDVEAARRRRTRELASIDLVFLGLENLDELRREALVAIEEAAAILGNERLRSSYATALARVPLR